MLRYAAGRVLDIPPVLVLVSVVIFSLIHLVPGDPVAAMVSPSTTEQQIDALRRELGLADPLPVQYGRWLGRALVADLGRSIRTGEEVRQMVADRLPASLTLAGLALLWALALAVPLGVVAAARRNTALDYGSVLLALLGQAIPNFVLAVVLILVFALWLRWVPVSVRGDVLKDPGTTLPSYVLPALTLGLAYAAQFTRLLRASLLDVLNREYILVARSKGLTERSLLRRHAIRNALIPLVTVVGTSFVYMLGSAIIVEQIFNVPGLGTLLVKAVQQRDIPVIQGVTLAVALVFVLSNLVVDVLYAALDPRIRAGR